jgi:hypothetical protein
MKTFISVLAVLVLCCSVGVAQTTPELVQLSVRDVAVENGKSLEMTFKEIERTPEFSMVQITFVSGGSVSSSMFVIRGMCAVAKARGEQYFRASQASKDPWRYRMTFLTSASPAELRPANGADKVFSRAECSMLNY